MQISHTLRFVISKHFTKTCLYLLVVFMCFACSLSAVTHALGETLSQVQIPDAPQRIVVFPLFAEEMLLEMVGPDRIVYVGHPYYQNGETYSPTMELTKNIKGQYLNMADEDEILALHPDMIILGKSYSRDYSEIFPKLAQTDIPFLFLDTPRSIADIRNTLVNLGEKVGSSEKANHMIETMDNELAKIAEIVSDVPAETRAHVIYYEFWNSEDGRSTKWFRQNSFVMAAQAAGVKASGPSTTDFILTNAKDLLIKQNPDIITFDYTDYDTDGSICGIAGSHIEDFTSSLLTDSQLSHVTAIRNHAIYPIRLCESQFIVQSAMELAQLAYPDQFTKQ